MAKAKKPVSVAAAAAPTIAKLQRHPLSEKFSLPTSEEERLALATDMAANGQHQEIITYEGMVLDGWERYMGCLQMGLTPKYKEYKGTNPAAVAFGANAIRRKLSSVQKALFGAKYFLHVSGEGTTGITQKAIAKSSCCSLQRLNEIVQLLRAADSNSDAARCVSSLNTNADITTAMLQTMLVDCGIIDINARKPATKPDDTTRADPEDESDDDEDSDFDGNVDDLLGGADIDDLLDDDTPSPRIPTPKGDKGNLPAGRIGHDHKSRETPASAAAKHFKALTEPERVDFVKFAWSMLRPAVEACVNQGRVEWPLLNAQADAGKAALADVTSVLAKASASSKKGAAAPAASAEPAPAAKPARGRAKPAGKAPSEPASAPKRSRKAPTA